jgi:HAD superfamily hydrolase (TIGR01490 family)
MSRPVAFFDIDGTVFRSSLVVELIEELIKEKIFPEEARQCYEDQHRAWLNREGSYESYIAAMVDVFYDYIKGVHYGEMADIGRVVVASHSKHVYRYTRDLIKKLKNEGYYSVAISQSPKAILDEFCENYGFDKVYGRIYEIGPTDRFTGEVLEQHLIENKANIVNRIFENHPDELTKVGSIAVGDTEGDIPMLELVDNPICFNPNQALYDEAKKMNWSIVVERKDVIYNI